MVIFKPKMQSSMTLWLPKRNNTNSEYIVNTVFKFVDVQQVVTSWLYQTNTLQYE
jgi:hypothetical protein